MDEAERPNIKNTIKRRNSDLSWCRRRRMKKSNKKFLRTADKAIKRAMGKVLKNQVDY